MPHDATVNLSDQEKEREMFKKASFENQNIKLHESPNPWRTLHKCYTPLDEKEWLKRKVQGVLNKLTPQKFETLVTQLKSLNIDTEEKLSLVISLIFERAIDEPNFSVLYANLCRHLALIKVPVSGTSGTQVNFRKLLLTKCQKEFEQVRSDELKNERKMKNLEAADPDKKKEIQLEYEEEEKKMRYRQLGNTRFIGELFKLGMLIEPIMHEFIKKLLSEGDEESLECLSQLLKTVGKELDDTKSTKSCRDYQMDKYFAQMETIVDKRLTSSRVRFKLQDVIDLKKNNWVPRRYENNPKTIDQIHKEAEREARELQQSYQNMTNYPKRISDDRDRRKNTGYYPSHGMSGYQSMPPQMPPQSIPAQPQPQNTTSRKGDISDSNICVQFAKQVAAVLNDSRSDITSKQPEPVRIDPMTHENEGIRLQEPPVGKKNKTKKKKDLNKRGESKEGEEIDAFLDTKESEDVLSVSPTPSVTTAAVVPTYVSTPVSESFPSSVPITDSKILNVIPLARVNRDTTLQRDIESTEPTSEISSISPSADKSLRNKIALFHRTLRYSYKEDQWSPLNPEGKKHYDREFLLQLQSHPLSLCKPSNLPKSSVIKDKFHIQELTGGFYPVSPGAEPKTRKKKARRDQKSSSTSNQKPQKSVEEMKEHLSSLLEKDAKLEKIFHWIDANVPETRDPAFIRALVTAVHKNCSIGSGNSWKVDKSKLKSRTPLISRYISTDEKLQLHALYAAQALSKQLNHPSGLLHQMFDVLYDEGIVSDEALVEWEKSDDPYEAKDQNMQ